MAKKLVLIAVAGALVLSLCACGTQSAGVSVMRADELSAASLAEDRYIGLVVSNDVEEIQRDSSKTVAEVYVTVGQKVSAGDKLFTYDSDALELDLEKAQLEVEKMTNEQTDYAQQVQKLEKQLNSTYDAASQARLKLEINTMKTQQMENDYNLAAKNKEIEKLQQMLENVDIVSPVDGTVRKIDEQGQTESYMTIQQSGAYRVKGSVNEMSIGMGIQEGARVRVFSRADDSVWTGTVSYIDLEGGSQSSNNYWYDSGSEMTSSTNYPFYVDLDSTDGLLLGQHVYMEVMAQEMEQTGLWVPESYLVDMSYDEQSGEMTAFVWADNGHGKLERKDVTLGMYDDSTGSYEILSGLSEQDYVADPSNPGCEAGAATIKRESADFSGNQTAAGENEAEQQDVEEMLTDDEVIQTEVQPDEETAG